MDKYYYFASQLGLLDFGQVPRINKENFLEEAVKWLSARDLSCLAQADINDFSFKPNLPGILKEYRIFEYSLRKEITGLRDPGRASGQRSLYLLTPDILEADPLEAEKKLLLLRWRFLEQREHGHYSDLDFFLIYYLKLQILERLFTFDKEKGIKRFDELCEVKL